MRQKLKGRRRFPPAFFYALSTIESRHWLKLILIFSHCDAGSKSPALTRSNQLDVITNHNTRSINHKAPIKNVT